MTRKENPPTLSKIKDTFRTKYNIKNLHFSGPKHPYTNLIF